MDFLCHHCNEHLDETAAAVCTRCHRHTGAQRYSYLFGGSSSERPGAILGRMPLQKAVMDLRPAPRVVQGTLPAVTGPKDKRPTVPAPAIILTDEDEEAPTLPFSRTEEDLVRKDWDSIPPKSDAHGGATDQAAVPAPLDAGQTLRFWSLAPPPAPTFEGVAAMPIPRDRPLFAPPPGRRISFAPSDGVDRAAATESLSPFAVDEATELDAPVTDFAPFDLVRQRQPRASGPIAASIGLMALLLLSGGGRFSRRLDATTWSGAAAAAAPAAPVELDPALEPVTAPAAVPAASEPAPEASQADRIEIDVPDDAPLAAALARAPAQVPVQALRVAPARPTPARPLDSEALARLGDEALAHHDHQGAKTFFAEAIAMNPSYLPAQTALADIQWADGDVAGARESYARILAEFPRDLVPLQARVRAASK